MPLGPLGLLGKVPTSMCLEFLNSQMMWVATLGWSSSMGLSPFDASGAPCLLMPTEQAAPAVFSLATLLLL